MEKESEREKFIDYSKLVMGIVGGKIKSEVQK
jgi:hypothetical protein